MGYTIRPSKNKDYIVLSVNGKFTGQDMMKYIVEAHLMGKEMQIDKFLVDVTKARNTDSVLGNYEFAYFDMKKMENINFRARVSALVSPGDHSHDFIETVLNNAGLSIKLFNDINRALNYLLKK